MKLKQLSLFLENKPGALSRPVRILAQAGFNILALSVADANQFGILRLILPDWEKAKQLLEREGFVVRITEMVAVEVADQPGGLSGILEVLDAARVNVEFMYACAEKRADQAVMVFRFDDPDNALRILEQHRIKVIDHAELLKRMGR